MIDLADIPDAVLIARGKYSTIRAAHEDEKKQLQILCGTLGGMSAQILRFMQPDNNGPIPSVDDLLSACRATVDKIEQSANNIESLAMQRAELRPIAWAK